MVDDQKIPPESKTTDRGDRYSSDFDVPPVADIGKNVGAAWAAAQFYLVTQLRRLQVVVRNVLLFSFLGIVAAVFAVSVIVCATVLLLMGIAGGLSSLLGGRQWAGDLITGFAVVLTVVVAGYLLVSRMMKAARLKTMSSYEKPMSKN